MVTDLVGSPSPCSQGAMKEMVSGRFYGTNNYCKTDNGPVLGGDCKQEGSLKVEGVPPRDIYQLNQQYLCFNRQEGMNYHKLVMLRSKT